MAVAALKETLSTVQTAELKVDSDVWNESDIARVQLALEMHQVEKEVKGTGRVRAAATTAKRKRKPAYTMDACAKEFTELGKTALKNICSQAEIKDEKKEEEDAADEKPARVRRPRKKTKTETPRSRLAKLMGISWPPKRAHKTSPIS